MSVQFSQMDDRQCFQITIVDNFDREDIETFEVVLLPNTGVMLVDPYMAIVTIIDDDNNRRWIYVQGSCLFYNYYFVYNLNFI